MPVFEMTIKLCFKLPFSILWSLFTFIGENAIKFCGWFIIFWSKQAWVSLEIWDCGFLDTSQPGSSWKNPQCADCVLLCAYIGLSVNIYERILCMYECVCLWFWLLAGRQVAAEVIPNSPLNGLLNSSASPRALPNTNSPPPQWNPVYALNWPLGHSSKDTTVEFLALHSHFCTALTLVLSMCEWVCMRGQQRMFGKCHFLPQSDQTGRGSSPFPDSSPIALLDPCARFLSNVSLISHRPKEWQTNCFR